jgi:hypothetical protein
MKKTLFFLSLALCISSNAQKRSINPIYRVTENCVDSSFSEESVLSLSDIFIPNFLGGSVDDLNECNSYQRELNAEFHTILRKYFKQETDAKFKFILTRKFQTGKICYSKYMAKDLTTKSCEFDLMVPPNFKIVQHTQIFGGVNAQKECLNYLDLMEKKHIVPGVSGIGIFGEKCELDDDGVSTGKIIVFRRLF